MWNIGIFERSLEYFGNKPPYCSNHKNGQFQGLFSKKCWYIKKSLDDSPFLSYIFQWWSFIIVYIEYQNNLSYRNYINVSPKQIFDAFSDKQLKFVQKWDAK